MSDPTPISAALEGRYTIERELGQGGMATVYLAQDLRHRRKVALKVLRPELAATMGADRFVREIEVAANLQHPHILPLFDSGEAGGFLFYVMPYVEGESLRARLERGGELPVAEAARILRDVADALAYAHQQGVVHRDIKPDNVLLSGRHALVTDFGVAKAVSEATGRQTLTTAGVALGTPVYMAPEQATADPHVDFHADLYAVGVMAYEMLTGRPPFVGPSPQAILAAHVTEAAKPITTVRHTVPAPLAQLVMQCLEKRPADRPASAEALLPPLEALATPSGGITPTATAPVAAVTGARRAARRIPRWALAAVGVVLVAAAGYAALRGLHGGAGAAARSVAVLPFENVGGDSANRAFTDGVQNEILTDLTSVGALQVTSRTSVEEYRHTSKSVKQIGAELGVRTLLEGQVQRAGSDVRVNVQLVDAAHDRQLWADSYDRELTAQNIFAIQGDIAQSVAHALQTNLTASQAAAVATPPTTNLEALDWYHRGNALFSERSGLNDTAVTSAFARAVALDSGFAEAWAGLAAARSWEIRDSWTTDTLPARTALDRAVALAPRSPETEIAQAYYAYYAKGDYAAALAHFETVAASRPGDVEALRGAGYLTRRQGRWDDALAAERRVTVLDPRDPGALDDLGESYALLRRYDLAAQSFRRALILDPSDAKGSSDLATTLLVGLGDTAGARATVAGGGGQMSALAFGGARWLLARWQRRYRAADAALDAMPATPDQKQVAYPVLHLLDEVAAGDTAGARTQAASVARDARQSIARASGPEVFGNLADKYTALGFAEAILGDAAAAVADGERAVALNPSSRDAIEGPRSLEGLIEIHVLLGHRDEALRLLEDETHRPLGYGLISISRAAVRMDPLFTTFRRDARVQALLADDAAWVVK
jgi:TolB-like protein/Flp pilus assembly protein TadD/tRNA A-37 threonylcarbamoyl transferase component Bud32